MSRTSTVFAHFLMQMHNKKKFNLENEGQSDGAQQLQFDGKYRICKRNYKSVKEITYFALAFTISDLLTFQFLYLENLGRCRGKQHAHL